MIIFPTINDEQMSTIPNISKYKSWPTTDCYQMMIRHWSLWASACWIASHRGLSHASDSVVFCGTSSTSAFFDGERKFDRCQWKPVLPHELGRQSTAAAVACKTMGFSGSSRFSGCRRQRVRKGAASCFRFSLRGVRETRHAMLNEHRWQHGLCARRFSGYVLHRAWVPHWHACVSTQLAAAKTANHSVKSCGSTLFFALWDCCCHCVGAWFERYLKVARMFACAHSATTCWAFCTKPM